LSGLLLRCTKKLLLSHVFFCKWQHAAISGCGQQVLQLQMNVAIANDNCFWLPKTRALDYFEWQLSWTFELLTGGEHKQNTRCRRNKKRVTTNAKPEALCALFVFQRGFTVRKHATPSESAKRSHATGTHTHTQESLAICVKREQQHCQKRSERNAISAGKAVRSVRSCQQF